MITINSTNTMPNLQPMVTVEFHNDSDGTVVSVQVAEGTKITEAATQANIRIPTLCHHPRLPSAGKCGMCVVGVEGGPTPTQLACSTTCRRPGPGNDGSSSDTIKVHLGGPLLNGLAQEALHQNLPRRQPEHTTFTHSGTPTTTTVTEIEDLANFISDQSIDRSSNSITYTPSLCVGCSRCVRACDQLQGMKVLEQSRWTTTATSTMPCQMAFRAGRPLSQTDCISCGQCTIFCPTGAIREVDHVSTVLQALNDPQKIVVLQTAPSVRVTLSEMFGGLPGECSEGRLVGAAKACGFRYVFDTNLAADLTIMEEAHELLQRIQISKTGSAEEKVEKPLPMFTSCCPAWINLVEQSYPELIPHISTCRSPLGMLSSIIRHYWWPRQINLLGQHGKRPHRVVDPLLQQTNDGSYQVDQSNLVVVAVMPCTAKKDEIARRQFRMTDTRQETDASLTVREFARLLELQKVARLSDFETFCNIPELLYDNPFGESSGAAILFGTTGGVLEAALRSAADILSGKSLDKFAYESVRGLTGIKESTIQLGADGEIGLNVAVCHQTRTVREYLSQLEEGKRNPHFVEVMACQGGCLGGGGLPQSRDGDILQKRMQTIYSMDEGMVIRKSHQNKAVKALYDDLLGEPLSRISHKLLHTHYEARPRKPPVTLSGPKVMNEGAAIQNSDSRNTIYIVYGTQSGTAAQAAKEIKQEIVQFVVGAKIVPIPEVSLVASNALHPYTLMKHVQESLGTLFVTCTFGEGEFPEPMEKLWNYLKGLPPKKFESFRYAVFGLGSSMYAVGGQFNRAAKRLDSRTEELGGIRMVDVGLGDDQDAELYRGALGKWLEKLLPFLLGKEKSGSSLLDPPEPLFTVAKSCGFHRSHFHPLPPGYHFVSMESTVSQVAKGYDRPASVFTFDLEDTGLSYEIGDHLAILPRNPDRAVEKLIALYNGAIRGSELLVAKPVDIHVDSPFPPTLSVRELLTQYLDICGRPSRNFFKMLLLLANSVESRNKLRALFAPDESSGGTNQFNHYTACHTYVDVLSEYRESALPPFEYLLSMIPLTCPRLYSIASSPLYRENKLELLVVLNSWEDPQKKSRCGLCTQFLFHSHMGVKVAVQVRKGILQPPVDPKIPIIMFGLGTGVAPFRAFMQHREAQLARGETLGKATLYVGYRHETKDYYLKDDFGKWVDDGVLTAVHPAFSHDNIEKRGGKLYFVSDLIEEKPRDLAKAVLLEKDAIHCYYCGPAQNIPQGIQDAMKKAVWDENGGGMNESDAEELFERMIRVEDRFHTECF